MDFSATNGPTGDQVHDEKGKVATMNTLKMPIATRLTMYFAMVLCHSVS